jgi:hypothetical protein
MMERVPLWQLDYFVKRNTAFKGFMDLVLCHLTDGYVPSLYLADDLLDHVQENHERYVIASCFSLTVARMGSSQQAFMGSGDTIWFWTIDVDWSRPGGKSAAL